MVRQVAWAESWPDQEVLLPQNGPSATTQKKWLPQGRLSFDVAVTSANRSASISAVLALSFV